MIVHVYRGLVFGLVTHSLFPLTVMWHNGWEQVFADYYDVTVDLFVEMSSLSFHPVRHLAAMLSQIAVWSVGGFLGPC